MYIFYVKLFLQFVWVGGFFQLVNYIVSLLQKNFKRLMVRRLRSVVVVEVISLVCFCIDLLEFLFKDVKMVVLQIMILIIVVMMRKIIKDMIFKILVSLLYSCNFGMCGFILLVILFFFSFVIVVEYFGCKGFFLFLKLFVCYFCVSVV